MRAVWVVGEGPLATAHAEAWRATPGVALARCTTEAALADLRQPDGPRPLLASIAAPPAERSALVATALTAGVHVLVAPPVARDAAGAEAVQKAAGGRALLLPAHVPLFTPGLLRVVAAVFARRFGAVQNVYSYRYGPLAERLPPEPEGHGPDDEIAWQAALVTTFCLLPPSRTTGVVLTPDDATLAATMFYEDDIVASVRVDPTLAPTRRGLLVTFVEAVLRWEVDADGERLALLRGPAEKRLPLGGEAPWPTLAMTALRAAESGVPPYGDRDAALRAMALELAWRLR